ncbi:MAG: zinc-ribbon domain-containing protein [Candidatus Acidiferrales bacterium]
MGNGPNSGSNGAPGDGNKAPSKARPRPPVGGFEVAKTAAIKCPKCGTETRDVARFCPRCHMTLRFFCPACTHEQRHGEKCDKCGVDFAKYIVAVVVSKQAEADALHDKIDRRTTFLTQAVLLPLTGGLSLLKYLFRGSSDRKNQL